MTTQTQAIASARAALAPRTIQPRRRNDARMSEPIRCTLEHLAKHGPCNFVELHAKFCADRSSGRAREQYRANLSYLVGAGHCKSSGYGDARTWELDYSPRQVGVPVPASVPALPAPDPRRAVAPGYDIMRAALYQPQAQGCTRPGAQDHLRYASFGVQC